MISGLSEAVFTHDGVDVAYSAGGEGAPLVLVHGFPQTRMMWARIAPALAQGRRVICPDLRGYGASSKPARMEEYSFRAMGGDILALMDHLGHDRFDLVGHDRGARTAHRIALDAPDRVASLTMMDIIPTHLLLTQLSHQVAKAYYHWFFLAQPEPFPETLIAADADFYYHSCLLGWGGATLDDFHPDQLAAYRAAWRDPDTIRGMCNDYRAAIAVDLALDEADLHRRVTCPTLVLYGADGAMARAYDVPGTWADRCTDLRAATVPGGHFFPDTAPQETLAAIRGFLDRG
ncbi:MAG: alpha/beta hydrolase [Paracoccaceae bacterium]|nr:alpha/beta hydrolase [Paracoccaceae bacterium]